MQHCASGKAKGSERQGRAGANQVREQGDFLMFGNVVLATLCTEVKPKEKRVTN